MKTLKTELFKVEFDQNDIKKMVHIEQISNAENYQSFFELVHVVKYVLELKRDWKLSDKEAIKVISKASSWLIGN